MTGELEKILYEKLMPDLSGKTQKAIQEVIHEFKKDFPFDVTPTIYLTPKGSEVIFNGRDYKLLLDWIEKWAGEQLFC
jgi:hypothetical protein